MGSLYGQTAWAASGVRARAVHVRRVAGWRPGVHCAAHCQADSEPDEALDNQAGAGASTGESGLRGRGYNTFSPFFSSLALPSLFMYSRKGQTRVCPCFACERQNVRVMVTNIIFRLRPHQASCLRVSQYQPTHASMQKGCSRFTVVRLYRHSLKENKLGRNRDRIVRPTPSKSKVDVLISMKLNW